MSQNLQQQQFQNNEQKRKYDLLLQMNKDDKDLKVQKIKEYQEVKDTLKNVDQIQKKEIDDQNKLKCFDPDCLKSYDNEKARDKNIVMKHKALAVKRKLISYFCELCEQFGTNSKSSYKSHLKACKLKQEGQLKISGIVMPREQELTQEQEMLYEKAKKFF